MRRAVFLDRDGTLVKPLPCHADIRLVDFLPGVREGLKLLAEKGYELIVVANNAGIEQDRFAQIAILKIQERLKMLFRQIGARLRGFQEQPKPELILKACQDLNVDPKKSWMIGDIPADVHAGQGAGCRIALIQKNNASESKADLVASTFLEAAKKIAQSA